jgi:predicted ATPase
MLHYGPKVTPQMEARLVFEVDNGQDTYRMRLFHAAGDTLVFAEERLEFLRADWQGDPQRVQLGAGHTETRVTEAAEGGDPVARVFRHLLNNCRVYQFHDTSETARIRQYCYVGEDRWLRPDAGNLAAILYRLKNRDEPTAYQRIVGTIRQIAPFFADFDLEPSGPSGKDIILNWRERSSDLVFGPHQLSDGTLRAMALISLLSQPTEDLPNVIVIDEPELGLHPFAKNVLGALMRKASHHCQVVVATQSAGLLDAFEPEDVVVVERDEDGSTFTRQTREGLEQWLAEYSIRELWEKNVLGGGPA